MNELQVQHTAGILGLSRLDPQEARFVTCIMQDLPLVAAGREAGIPRNRLQEVLARPHVAQTITYLRDQYATETIVVTRDRLNAMLFEAHGKAANTTEEVMAIRELGKMNGLYAPEKVERTDRRYVTFEQINSMSTDELLQLAEEDSLEPQTYEGELDD